MFMNDTFRMVDTVYNFLGVLIPLHNGFWILLFLATYGFSLFFYYGIRLPYTGAIYVIGSFWYHVFFRDQKWCYVPGSRERPIVDSAVESTF